MPAGDLRRRRVNVPIKGGTNRRRIAVRDDFPFCSPLDVVRGDISSANDPEPLAQTRQMMRGTR